MADLMKRNNYRPAFNSFFDDFFAKDLFDWNDKNAAAAGNTLPSVNLKETEDDFQIELAAPGMKKEDFKIELDKNLLTISAEKKEENEEVKKGKYTRREFSYESFVRSFTLPAQVVDSERIAASYNAGILHVTVPKKETAKPQPARSISVN